MNNKGFTLVELLATLVIIGIVFGISLFILKGTQAKVITDVNEVSDGQIFTSAETYVLERNLSFNRSNYVCVSVQELIDYGYIKNTSEPERIIKLIRNNETKTIETIKYVDSCN